MKARKSIIEAKEQRRPKGRVPRVTLGKKKRMEGPRHCFSIYGCRRNEKGRRRVGEEQNRLMSPACVFISGSRPIQGEKGKRRPTQPGKKEKGKRRRKEERMGFYLDRQPGPREKEEVKKRRLGWADDEASFFSFPYASS